VIVQSSAARTDGGPAAGTVVVTTDQDGNREMKTYRFGDAGGGSGIRLHASRVAEPAGPVTYLGVAVEETRDDLAAHLPIERGTGLVALSVAKDSPAAQAGLQENDVLATLDDQVLIHPRQLQVLVRNKQEGDKVKLAYVRKGKLETATVVLIKKEVSPEEWRRELRREPGGAARLDLHDLVGELQRGQDPLFHRQTVIVGPKGEVRTWMGDRPDLKKIADDVIENLKKAGVAEDIQERVRRSIVRPEVGPRF